MFIPELVSNIKSVLQELNIDQAVIDSVVSTLERTTDSLEGSRFPDLHVPESAFGSSSTGTQLGYHHLKAHQVISDTLQGLVADLNGFRDGVRRAEQLVATADNDSATDLTRTKSAVELIVDVSTFAEGDRRNHESRNRNLGHDGVTP